MTISEINSLIDQKYHAWFPYSDFNQIQKQCLSTLLNSDENVVISAPTGSGKTTLFEISMIRLFKSNPSKKILYLSPMRALCSEKASLWRNKFRLIHKSCSEFIGGDSSTNSEFSDSELIISTPEKWDYMTRSNNHLDQIGLILIDEVHILNDQRGSILEAIISRMRMKLPPDSYRIVAVSATIPNISNLATWLRSAKTNKPAKILKFPDSLRPVPLKTHIVSMPMNGKNGYTFDYGLNYKLQEILTRHSNDKPALIFCSTRKSTIKTIDFLASTAVNDCDDKVVLEDKKLQELVSKYKLAYHHAGLSTSDREAVEDLFRKSKIRVLCSTSTLATGVNLPAHLVIIKSTLQYTEAGYFEYNDLDIRQMIGRAGRAGYDTSGVAVILTSTQTEHLYRTISEGKLEIDSQLLDSFIEFLNTEIANQNIQSFSDAMKWLSYTFLHVRMSMNPSKYNLKTDESIQSQLEHSMKLYLKELSANGVIEYTNHKQIQSTPLGQAMARNFIKFKSLKELLKANFTEITEISDILKLISQNSEITNQISFKSGDKILLQKIASNSELIYPISGKLNWDVWKKPFLLIQVALQSELGEFEAKLTPLQRSDQQSCIENAARLIKFIVQVASRLNLALLLRNSLEFLSSLNGKSWHTNAKLLQQVPGIGKIGSNSLFYAGIRSLDKIRETDESRLEVLLKRNPPFGRNLKREVKDNFPHLTFDCNLIDKNIIISLKSESQPDSQSIVHLLIIAYGKSSSRILLHHPTTLSSLHSHALNRTIEISNFPELSFSCSLMFEDWAGLNQNVCFDLPKSIQEKEQHIEINKDCDMSEFENTLDYSDLSDLDKCEDVNNPKYDTNLAILSERHLQHPHPNIPSPSISSTSSSSSSLNACKHICKDKLNCAHVCCKSRLMTPKRSTTPPTPNTTTTKRLNCLSSSKRSLTNAREYLRKYQPINLITSSTTSSLLPKSSIVPTETTTLFDEIEIALRSIE